MLRPRPLAGCHRLRTPVVSQPRSHSRSLRRPRPTPTPLYPRHPPCRRPRPCSIRSCRRPCRFPTAGSTSRFPTIRSFRRNRHLIPLPSRSSVSQGRPPSPLRSISKSQELPLRYRAVQIPTCSRKATPRLVQTRRQFRVTPPMVRLTGQRPTLPLSLLEISPTTRPGSPCPNRRRNRPKPTGTSLLEVRTPRAR